MKTLFFVSLVLLVYPFLGYRMLLTVLAPLVSRFRKPPRSDDGWTPTVSMVISLHNEEQLIATRIDDFERLDYPTDKLELVLGDDCSTDQTRAIIRERISRNPQIRLVEFDTHQGKTEVINRLAPACRSDIIAFSDGNTFWERDALRKMVRHFADPRVGAVCGHMNLHSPTGQNVEQNYWRGEASMKVLENDLGVLLGANGGIYTLRKELFRPLKSSVVQIDDFIWPVRVYERGYVGVYECEAIAVEDVSPTVEAEFRRKIRIGTGNYRALMECWRLLLPWRGWVAFVFWSHKVLRWCSPLLLLAVLVSNAFLLSESLFRALFFAQLAFYACALAGRVLSAQRHLLAKLCRVPYYFVASNLALMIGFYKCITGRQQAAWSQKVHRAS